MISEGKSVKDVVKGKKPKEVVKEVGHAVADVAFAGGAEKALKLSKKYKKKIAKDELAGAAYRKKPSKLIAATDKHKAMKEANKRKWESADRLAEAAQGKPLALSQESWDSARENGGTNVTNNPYRINNHKVDKKDMNTHDKFYLGVRKGTAAHKKEEELKKLATKKKEAKANGATEQLRRAKRMMNSLN